MYNPQLKTFLQVADSGSFNKAAETLYITTPAVIKQINMLERNLGVALFDRSPRGLTLTEAGRSLYTDAKYIIQYCSDAAHRARKAMRTEENTIRIGSSLVTPAVVLLELWPQIQQHYPELSFNLVSFENTRENAILIPDNLGENIDIVAGVFDETTIAKRKCSGTFLTLLPVCVGVSRKDPLSQKSRLSVEDLYGRDLMMVRRGWSHNMDRVRDDLTMAHPQIRIVDFSYYSVDAYNRCENTGSLLILFGTEDTPVHPLIKVIPVDWEYTMPYGLMHAAKPSKVVSRFLEAIQKVDIEI